MSEFWRGPVSHFPGQVYNEEINDLLQSGEEGKNLRIVSEDPVKGPVIGGLIEEEVKNKDEFLQVVDKGEGNRAYGSTQVGGTQPANFVQTVLMVRVPRVDE